MELKLDRISRFVAQSLENGKLKCVACINTDNRLVITKKKLQKTKTKTLYAGKEENEEMSKRKTKISADVFAARDHLDVKIA